MNEAFSADRWKRKLDDAEMAAVGTAVRQRAAKPSGKPSSANAVADRGAASRQDKIDAARKADQDAIAEMLAKRGR